MPFILHVPPVIEFLHLISVLHHESCDGSAGVWGKEGRAIFKIIYEFDVIMPLGLFVQLKFKIKHVFLIDLLLIDLCSTN